MDNPEQLPKKVTMPHYDDWTRGLAHGWNECRREAIVTLGPTMADMWALIEAIAADPEETVTAITVRPPSLSQETYKAVYASVLARQLVKQRDRSTPTTPGSKEKANSP